MPRPAIGYENYVRIRLGGWRLWMHKDLPGSGKTVLSEDGLFDGVRGPFQKIPSSRYARVFKCSLSLPGRIEHFYLKQYLHRSACDFVKHLFRPSRAMRSLKATLLLARNGLAAPPVIAVGEDRQFFFRTRCFVVTSQVEQASPVYAWLGRLPADERRTRVRRRDFIRRLGSTVGRMHAREICHGDLRPGNVLAADTADGWQFYLIDNERTIGHKHLPHRLRVKNLVQIGMLTDDQISRTDRMRFFQAYLQENPSQSARRRSLAAVVLARIRQRLAGKTPVFVAHPA
ncbi:MAG: hypothetical protein IH624_05390 [Phycisphaerae bacterium]|nr:hypothetical protein [Phycisphaerae bacterium]